MPRGLPADSQVQNDARLPSGARIFRQKTPHTQHVVTEVLWQDSCHFFL